MAIVFGRRKSVSKVVAVIQGYSGGISQKDIIAETGLSERSVKYALKELIVGETVREFFVPKDIRCKLYVRCQNGLRTKAERID